jgi:rubrerythrin
MTTSPLPILDSLDPELLERTVSRRDALFSTGKQAAAFAIASAPLALGVMARKAFAQGSLPSGIVDVLNFALTLEYLEAEFYVQGLAASNLIPAQFRPGFAQISKHETAHVALLKSVLGTAAVPKPTFDFTANGAFPTVFSDYTTFLALAQGFEDTGVRAYKGQAGALISDNGILTVALQIHSVEARHAAYVRRLRGQKGWISGNTIDVAALASSYAGEENTIQGGVQTSGYVSVAAATEAFDEPLSKAAVLAIAGQFVV